MVVHHEPEDQRFVAEVPGGTAELLYSMFGDGVLNLEHTEVPPAARGLHVGDALIRAALASAREQG